MELNAIAQNDKTDVSMCSQAPGSSHEVPKYISELACKHVNMPNFPELVG
jgi:hypothetical protein